MTWLIGCPSGLHANDGRCSCPEMPGEQPRPTERDAIHKGLIEALRLLRSPTDKPECDLREIQTRVRAAAEFVRTLPEGLT